MMSNNETIYLGGGLFGVLNYFHPVKGVELFLIYEKQNANYKDVCSGNTGTEVVKVVLTTMYDLSVQIFFTLRSNLIKSTRK